MTTRYDEEKIQEFYDALIGFIDAVFECERRRQGINFRFPRLVVQGAFVVAFILVMLTLM